MNKMKIDSFTMLIMAVLLFVFGFFVGIISQYNSFYSTYEEKDICIKETYVYATTCELPQSCYKYCDESICIIKKECENMCPIIAEDKIVCKKGLVRK